MKKFFAFMLIGCFMMVSFCTAEEKLAYKEELNVASTQDFLSLFPYDTIDETYSMEVMYMVFDTLMAYDEYSRVNYYMIDEGKIGEDYKTYTIKLKNDLYWHDGNKVTGEDVKFSVEYAKNSNNDLFKNAVKSINTVSVNDNYVTFELSYSNPNLYKEMFCILPIIPKHVYEKEKPHLPIGSGPYKVTSYEKDKFYLLESVEGYAIGQPTTLKIRIDIVKDENEIIKGLDNGKYSIAIGDISKEIYDGVKNSSVKKEKESSYDTQVLYLNLDNEYLKNNETRKAISKSIDYDRIINQAYKGMAQKGNPTYFKRYLDYANREFEYKYDLNEANSILDNSGLNKNEKNERGIELNLRYEKDDQEEIAKLLKEDFDKVGIKLNISKDFENYDLLIKDINSYLMPVESSILSFVENDGYLNLSNYQSDGINKALNDYKGVVDPKQRYYALMDIQKCIGNEIPFITLLYEDNLMLYNYGDYNYYLQKPGCGIFNKMSFIENKKTIAIDSNANVLNQNDNLIINKAFIGGVVLVFIAAGFLAYFYLNKIKK